MPNMCYFLHFLGYLWYSISVINANIELKSSTKSSTTTSTSTKIITTTTTTAKTSTTTGEFSFYFRCLIDSMAAPDIEDFF